jgi:hypothetical protein
MVGYTFVRIGSIGLVILMFLNCSFNIKLKTYFENWIAILEEDGQFWIASEPYPCKGLSNCIYHFQLYSFAMSRLF